MHILGNSSISGIIMYLLMIIFLILKTLPNLIKIHFIIAINLQIEYIISIYITISRNIMNISLNIYPFCYIIVSINRDLGGIYVDKG